ncbi:uncharacterized protein DUF58 [Halanaerobium saccharolyticum]|uniref:Uncharacterized protein DUF58 n=1 Tax=Halanaerobium saccharolyticum TaxID=43595 RepID=A0A2T5RQE4_9FIRM|nr:uncharacterized protein DUF58 [Halanaerobium saccharolyticum]
MINFFALGLVTYLGGAVLQRTVLFKLAYFFLLFHFTIKYYHYNISKNLKINHYLENDHLFYNEEIKVTIEVENNSFLPILWLKFDEYLPGKLTTLEEQHLSYFKAGEKKEWTFSLKAKKRGLYKIGPLRWEMGDFLGYELTKGELKELEVYIYPKILNLEELGLASRLPFGKSKWPQPIYQDPYRTAGIREYQGSDRMNQIHWKASAKTGELKSRKNESTVSIDTALVLNMSQEDYGHKFLERKTELAVTATASIAYYLNRIGHSYKFMSNAVIEGENREAFNAYQAKITEGEVETELNSESEKDENSDSEAAANDKIANSSVSDAEDVEHDFDSYLKLPSGNGDGHLQQLLELLARVDISQADNFLNLLTDELDLAWGGTLIIFTEKDDSQLMQVVENLMRRGYNIKIMIMGDEVVHREFRYRFFTAPLSIHHLRKERDLHES